MDETSSQNRTRRPDRVTVRDRATLDVDDVLRQAELAGHDNGDRRERLVDLDPLDVAEPPKPVYAPGSMEYERQQAEKGE